MAANSPYVDGGAQLAAGQYLATPPTNPTTDTYRNLQVDASGNLKVTVAPGGGGGEVTIGDPNTSTNQAAVLAPGSSGPFALAVQGVTGGTPQPVSASSLPLPTGAATAAKQPAIGTAGAASTDVITVQGIASGTAQPISAASLPLPTGASTSAKQPALGTAGTASADVITVQGIASMTALKTDGSAVTQPISAASLPLPSGAATSAKQPALGTAGSASADVLTVQGIASMTALKTDGSAVTQPVSGTVTANAGTGFPSTTSAGASGTNLITVQGAASGVPQPMTTGQYARTDKSGTITSGGTAQDVFSAGQATHGFYFQNLSTVAMYIRDDGTAASAGAGSILVAANGGYYENPSLSTPTSKLSVFCATTASAFTCKVW